MMVYGYNKTSRQRTEEASGSDPEAQAMQLRQERAAPRPTSTEMWVLREAQAPTVAPTA